MNNITPEEILQKLGYDTYTSEAIYCLDVVGDICNTLEMEGEEQARKMIPCCFVEFGHFIYEGVGIQPFIQGVCHFFENCSNFNADFSKQVYGTETSPSVEESIFLIAKYAVNSKEHSQGKVLVK